MDIDERLEESIENKYMQDDRGKNEMKLTIEESVYILKRRDFNMYVEDKAIETLLTAYEKEKEDNKELRKYYATRKEVEELREINECLHDSAENYIHKDKKIEKVIEVKDRPVKDEFITATQGKLNTIIDIESLLDKEE